MEVLGLRPNDNDSPLRTVRDRLDWEQRRLPVQLRRLAREAQRNGAAGPELLYSPALGAPWSSPVPVVAHVHDLIPLRFPEQFSGWAGLYWKRLLPATWRRCRTLTVSNSWLVREVSTHLPFPAERIHVVPYLADPQLSQIASRLEPEWRERRLAGRLAAPDREPLFLCLGSQEQRKNFALAIEALSLLRARGIRARLRIIGGETAYSARLKDFARRAGVEDAVEFAGYAEREALVRSMLESSALLFVSRYEGYGMPPQEAQSLGLPVVLSDIPCHRAVYDDPGRRERCGNEHVPPPFVDLGDAEALAQTMQRLLEDVQFRASLAQSGFAYQGTFSAQETAFALRAAFEKSRPAAGVTSDA